jgi:plastocyanin
MRHPSTRSRAACRMRRACEEMGVTGRFTGGVAIVTLSTLLTASALMIACGGSDPATSPSPGGDGVTITISSTGVSPRNVTVTPGTQVTFVNNDSRIHQMSSNPHPEHTDCPEINFQGQLAAGEHRQTGNLNDVRTCGFHDHLQNTNSALQGTITIR